MILPDSEILKCGETLITPFDPKRVQPASYDLSLHEEILIPIANRRIDLRKDKPKDHVKLVKITPEIVLHPGQSVLGSTVETIHCPLDCVARVEGKSSLGRLFLAVHVTAGFVDPGFSGQVTLEIVNHGYWELVLWPGMLIAQINFSKLLYSPEKGYGTPSLNSHYQNQKGPTAALGK
jgi:dCTP deaminase